MGFRIADRDDGSKSSISIAVVARFIWDSISMLFYRYTFIFFIIAKFFLNVNSLSTFTILILFWICEKDMSSLIIFRMTMAQWFPVFFFTCRGALVTFQSANNGASRSRQVSIDDDDRADRSCSRLVLIEIHGDRLRLDLVFATTRPLSENCDLSDSRANAFSSDFLCACTKKITDDIESRCTLLALSREFINIEHLSCRKAQQPHELLNFGTLCFSLSGAAYRRDTYKKRPLN